MDRGASQPTVYGVRRVGHNLATKPPQPPQCCCMVEMNTALYKYFLKDALLFLVYFFKSSTDVAFPSKPFCMYVLDDGMIFLL